MKFSLLLSILLVPASCGVNLGSSESRVSEAGPPTVSNAAPGDGIICAFTIYAVLEAVGRRCLQGQHPKLEAELNRAVDRIGSYIVTNGGMSVVQLGELRAQQTEEIGQEAICKSDWLGIYQKMALQEDFSAAELRRSTDELVSQPGQPTWGTCV